MAMEGLWALACAWAIACGAPTGAPPATPDRDSAIADTLAVQTAMQQARDLLLHNNSRGAVEVLERQLSRINGNPLYLTLLRDAYRAYIQQLRLAKRETEADQYARRLAILDAEAPRNRGGAKATEAVTPAATFRGYREDDDFFRAKESPAQQKAKDLLSKAEHSFGANQFHDAEAFFEQADRTDSASTRPSTDRWAYCKLHRVTEQLNQKSAAFASLETDVRSALSLNVNLGLKEYAQRLLAEIEKRRAEATASKPAKDEPATVQHLGKNNTGWNVAETASFRVYYQNDQTLADQAVQIAERTRSRMFAKWFGSDPGPWNPKCDLILYPSGQEYSRASGVPASSPGHSSFFQDGSRRIELHADVPDMLVAVLPHETTHTVLAGNFGPQPIPRWADEGIAVLTEPRAKIDRHLRKLPDLLQSRQLFNLQQLVTLNDYPGPQQMGAFYAQGVSLVDFLAQEKGPRAVTQFVRDGMATGWEPALQKHFSYRSFEELERHWMAYAFKDVKTTGLARTGS